MWSRATAITDPLPIRDRYWEPGMSLEAVLKLLRKCLAELRVRFVANLPEWTIKVVDKNGVSRCGAWMGLYGR